MLFNFLSMLNLLFIAIVLIANLLGESFWIDQVFYSKLLLPKLLFQPILFWPYGIDSVKDTIIHTA